MKSLQIFGTIAALVWGVSAQFPRDCTTDIALNDRECCPLLVTSDGISSKCGTMQQRGNCEDIEIFVDNDLDNETEFQLSLDERKMWPKMFYDRACRCHGNFDGINCGVCKPGYGGPNCESVMPLLVRKNILKMPRNEVNEFVDVLDKSKHTTSERYVILTSTYDQILAGARPQFSNISVYDLFVWMHYYVARNNLVPNERNIFDEVEDIELVMTKLNPDLDINDEHDYAHEGPAFLPWHRYFLLKWENEVRELMGKPGFTIPYWDWRESETCEVCNDEFMGGRSSNNVNLISNESVFSKWQVICTKDDEYILNGKQCDGEPEGPLLRNFGAYDPSVIAGLPTTEDVRTSLRFSAYETFPYNRVAHGSFRNVIEGFADPKSGEATAGFSTMHNAVHLYMNGTMSEVGSSANDPIFILHHAFIDSIYELWLREQSRQQLFLSLDGPRSNISVGHNLQDFMVPFFPLVRQIEGFRTSAELGLKYEYIPESEAGSGDFDVDVQIDEDIGKRSDKKESPNNVLDFIFEENLIQAEERFFSEGNFEALTVEGVVSTVTKMKVVKRISRVRPIKKKTVLRKVKQNPKHRVAEGGIDLTPRRQMSPKVGLSSAALKQTSNADVGVEMNSFWNKLMAFAYDWQKFFTNMSINDQIVFFFVVGVTIFCVFLLILVCCSFRREQREEKNIKKGPRNPCYNWFYRETTLDYDAEESQGLLETCEDGKLKCKVGLVLAKTYTYENDDLKNNLEYNVI